MSSLVTVPKLTWQRIRANGAGNQLPWPTFGTDAEHLSRLIKEHDLGFVASTGSVTIASKLDGIFHNAYLEQTGEPAENLMWVGINGRKVLDDASFGARRTTYAVRQGEERSYSPASIALSFRLNEEVPALVALRSSALHPDAHKRNLYAINAEISNFDIAVAGLFIVTSPS